MGDTQADRPYKDSVDFFVKVMNGHNKVESIETINRQTYNICRTSGDTIRVYLTNIYTIGIADYYEIKEKVAGLNCIVTASKWNKYTDDAKSQAIQDDIGLFTIEEFMGALNVQDFYLYNKSSIKRRAEPGRR